MPFNNAYWRMWTAFWPCTSSTCGNWPAIGLLHQPISGTYTFNVEHRQFAVQFMLSTSGNNWFTYFCRSCRNLSEYMKIAERVKEFFHNEGIHSTTIQPEFVELELQSVTGTSTYNSLKFVAELMNISKPDRFRSDGVSTNLNISGSHDSCALDCPTTDEGCVQATCCQNNNKVCSHFSSTISG